MYAQTERCLLAVVDDDGLDFGSISLCKRSQISCEFNAESALIDPYQGDGFHCLLATVVSPWKNIKWTGPLHHATRGLLTHAWNPSTNDILNLETSLSPD
ncbi:hypothetical protein E4T56_gene8096 [Termitomyces sp. T112]|nr:hypothetical protein E4T56_gene8096 [Termitomyces sp. T112]